MIIRINNVYFIIFISVFLNTIIIKYKLFIFFIAIIFNMYYCYYYHYYFYSFLDFILTFLFLL